MSRIYFFKAYNMDLMLLLVTSGDAGLRWELGLYG